MTTNCIKYKTGYKYQLSITASYELAPDQYLGTSRELRHQWGAVLPGKHVKVFKGYAWDGPSGPTFDTPSFMRGSLFHDFGYQLMREGLIDTKHRDEWDKLLREICLKDGMWSIRAWYVYYSVKRFAAKSAVGRNAKKVLTAPRFGE